MANFKCRIIVGSSADGKITILKGTSSKFFQKYLTPDMSRPLIEARKQANGVLVSWRTVNIDNPSLLSNENPRLIRIILDRNLHSRINSKAFNLDAKTVVVTLKKRGTKLEKLKKMGVEVLILDEQNFLNNLKKNLIKIGVNNLLVEGGGNLNRFLIENKFADHLSIAYFPFLVGGVDTPTVIDGLTNFKMDTIVKLEIESYEIISKNMLLINYKIM